MAKILHLLMFVLACFPCKAQQRIAESPPMELVLVSSAGIGTEGKHGIFDKWLKAKVKLVDGEAKAKGDEWASYILNFRQKEFSLLIGGRDSDQRVFQMPVGEMTRGEALTLICQRGGFVVVFTNSPIPRINVVPEESVAKNQNKLNGEEVRHPPEKKSAKN